MISSTANQLVGSQNDVRAPRDARTWEAAKEFESVFLAEMLSKVGIGETRKSFGGGAGEDAFAGLLVSEQAKLLVDRGGIGLAERVYTALMGREATK